jgi:DNA-binding transcriptional regulator YdaS (Cro superfamily)
MAGNQSRLAALLGVTPQAVQQWVDRNRVPAERCVAVERAVDGQVTRYELNPDVFGQAPVAGSVEPDRRTPSDRRTSADRRKREAA